MKGEGTPGVIAVNRLLTISLLAVGYPYAIGARVEGPTSCFGGPMF
jgi:hypothetical protein